MMQTSGLRTWIEIDRKAIRHNYKVFRSLISKNTKLCAVVKSNAYGHNFIEFSKEMSKLGADYFAVDSIVEGVRLRKEGITKPIFVLGYTLPERLQEAADHNIEITVSTLEMLEKIIKLGSSASKLEIHIKVDTGMSRQGFLQKDQKKLMQILSANRKNLQVVGLYTHFASAKNPAFPQETRKQLAIFESWVSAFRKAGFRNLIIHAAATSGTLLYPDSHFDMVRIGIGLYGLWPSKETQAFSEEKIKLKPLLSWKTIVSEIKEIPAGEKIGYDGTEILQKKTKIAICPIGYWHGYSRRLSGIGHVLVKGKRARVVGRISMDMIVLDISKIHGVKVGEEVALIGNQGKEEISVYEIANFDDTTWYETVTRINPLIRRVYT